MTLNDYTLDPRERRQASRILAQLPEIKLSGVNLAPSVYRTYRKVLRDNCAFGQLRKELNNSLRIPSGTRGYVLIDGLGEVLANDLNDLRFPTAIASLVGRPFRAYDRWPLWKPLSVNLSAEPMRATGTGLNPFHVDLVNTEQPPEYVCFFGVRSDPAGGGATIISNLARAVEELPPDVIDILRMPIFREGEFYDLSGVGAELTSFPILGSTDDGLSRTRFSGKSVLCQTLQKEGAHALEILSQALEKNRELLVLRKGQLLILNQLIVAHGRLPLGPQEGYSPNERRLILQLFLRQNDRSFQRPTTSRDAQDRKDRRRRNNRPSTHGTD